MVTRLEDFLRRRSKIELVTRPEDLKNADGLREACEIFFEENADERLQEYFQLKDNDPSLKTRLASLVGRGSSDEKVGISHPSGALRF